jgi:hypothetical protein
MLREPGQSGWKSGLIAHRRLWYDTIIAVSDRGAGRDRDNGPQRSGDKCKESGVKLG